MKLSKILVCFILVALAVTMVSSALPFSNIPLAYATDPEATDFTWQLKGHDVYGTGQDWSTSKLWTSALSINSTSANTAEWFVFEGINRAWLDGKYFRWCWAGYYNSSGENNEPTFFVQIYDGQYDRTNATEFPVGSALLEKGAGKLQEYAQNCTPGSFAPEVHELLLDTSSGTENNATIFFRFLDPWAYDTLNLVLFWTQVSEGSGGVSVLKGGHFVDSTHWPSGSYAGYIVTGGAALQISKVKSAVTNWTETIDIAYLGYSLGQTSLSQLQTEIDKLANSSWMDILYWYAVTRKFGLENQTTIERALDNAVIMANGLPNSSSYGGGSYCVYDRYLILGYNWSEKYAFETAKWNKTQAFESFKTAVDWLTYPPLWVFQNNTSYAYSSDPRYYDETSETIDVFRAFAEIGVPSALAEANKWWDWLNINHWNSTGEFYIYKGSAPNAFECEAGGMEQIIWRLYNLDGTIGNASRMMLDAQTRFLNNSWNSYQWTFQSVPSFYVVNHEHSGTRQQRLSNTVMAWSALLGVYRNLSTTYQQTIQEMLNGSAYSETAPIPAWALLGSKSASLWNTDAHFKWEGTGESSHSASAAAANLMLNLAVVPETGTMAIPLEELKYEYQYSLIDRDISHINLTTYNVRFAVASAGNFTFMFGGIPFQYELNQTGLWDLTFASDWNSITTATRLSALPSNRVYLTRVMYADASLNLHILNSDGVPLYNATAIVNAYDVEATYYSDVNGWVNVTASGTTTYKVMWQNVYVYGLNTTIIGGVNQTLDINCNVFDLNVTVVSLETGESLNANCTIITPSMVAYGVGTQVSPTTFNNLPSQEYIILASYANYPDAYGSKTLASNDNLTITIYTVTTVTIIEPTNTTYDSGSFPVNFTASGGTVDKRWCNVWNGSDWAYVSNQSYTVPLTLSGFADGSYTFYAYANNTLGTEGSSSVMFTVKIAIPGGTDPPIDETPTTGGGSTPVTPPSENNTQNISPILPALPASIIPNTPQNLMWVGISLLTGIVVFAGIEGSARKKRGLKASGASWSVARNRPLKAKWKRVVWQFKRVWRRKHAWED